MAGLPRHGMATSEVAGIVPGADSQIHDEPHVEGSRITVRYLQRRVEEVGDDPRAVAEAHGIDVGDVYAALAYYHANPEEMRDVEERRETLATEADERTDLTPPDE